LEKQVLENHKIYSQRKEIYLSYGLDIDKERKFIVDVSQPLFGDILEVGTGKGYFTIALAKEGLKFTSLDISPKEQSIAKLNLRYQKLDSLVEWIISDAESLDFLDNSFDIIFAVNLFHHLKRPFKAIDEFIRVLSFEGKLIISDFNDTGFRIVEKIHAGEGRKHTKTQITLKELKEYLKKKQFKVEIYENKFQEVLTAYQPLI
jgi:ubiquinone/menaquinone biosynthesis C-methylase UbiE